MIDKTELLDVLAKARVVFDPADVLSFMTERAPVFYDRTALDLLDQGDGRVVIEALDALASAAYS